MSDVMEVAFAPLLARFDHASLDCCLLFTRVRRVGCATRFLHTHYDSRCNTGHRSYSASAQEKVRQGRLVPEQCGDENRCQATTYGRQTISSEVLLLQ
jgi:hypothetical protein